MTSRLPSVLTADDMSLAELQAAALDGDVFRLDQAFCSIAEFDVPWRRAQALAHRFAPGLVVAGLSAAWVWGATATAPVTHDAFGSAHQLPSGSSLGLVIRAVRPDAADLVDFGPVRVTSPTRTIVDLARSDPYDDDVGAIIAHLADGYSVERAACESIIERRRNLPHKWRARYRLDAVGLR